MALASFKLLKCTGTDAASETDSSKEPNLLSTDSATDSAASAPIRIPSSGTTKSYECWLRLECTAAPDNYCENFKVYGPSTQPDDPRDKVTLYVGDSASGVTPTDSTSSVATTIQHSNHYQAGNALVFDDVNETVTSVTDKTRYFVLQLSVAPFAEGGQMNPVILHFLWDET